MARFVFAFLVLFSMSGIVFADNCGRQQVIVQQPVVNSVKSNVVQQVQVQQALISTFVPVNVAVPQYSIGYNQDGDTAKAIRELTDEVKKMRESFTLPQNNGNGNNGNGNGNGNAGGKTVEERAIALLQVKCASCHSGTTAKNGYQIFLANGSFNKDKFKNFEERDEIYDKVVTGQMPKPPLAALADDEADLLRDWKREIKKIKANPSNPTIPTVPAPAPSSGYR